MDSYSEVRRVRKAMSNAARHDIHELAAMYNERRVQAADRVIDPGTEAERCYALICRPSSLEWRIFFFGSVIAAATITLELLAIR